MPDETIDAGVASSSTREIRSIQALRAVAALFVVAFHSTVLWHDKFSPYSGEWQNGNSGVDLFFVISGFIITFSSHRFVAKPGGWSAFLKARLIRIVPLYWLMTAAKLASIAIIPAMALHTRPTGWNMIASFLFIPAKDGVGSIRPVLEVGWTLSYEMLFYLLFAGGLYFTRDLLSFVAPTLMALVAVSIVRGPSWPTFATLADPLILEFLFGMLIGRFMMSRAAWQKPGWMLFIASGVAVLAFVPTDGRWQRTFIWGIAAASAVSGAVMSERWLGPRIPDWLIRIGESSYSLYLIHGFMLPPLAVLIIRLKFGQSISELGLVAICVISSAVAAVFVYHLIELPTTTYLRRRLAANPQRC